MNHSFDNQYTLFNILSKTSVKEHNDVMRDLHYVKYESYYVTHFAERKNTTLTLRHVEGSHLGAIGPCSQAAVAS